MASLPSAADLYSQSQQQLSGFGNSQRAALAQSYRNALGSGMQSLASTGLAGTTIAPSMRMGYMRQYQQSLNSLSDQLAQQRLSSMATFGLGGLQSDQAQQQLNNQMELGRGNLAINRQNADLAKQQLDMQRQNQAYQQAYQSTAYNQNLINQHASNIPYGNTQAGWSDRFNQGAARSYANFNYGWGG